MGWHLLETLLQQVGEHSTLVGKLWVTATFVFRFVIVASVGDAVYSDDQSDFNCNTGQPGCENVCFNLFSPISHLRFWAAQIIAVCTPSIVFIVYAAHMLLKQPQLDSEDPDGEEGLDEIENEVLPPQPQTRGPRKRKAPGRVPSNRSRRSAQPMTPRHEIGMVRGFANPPGEATEIIEEIKEEESEGENADDNEGDDTADENGENESLSEIQREIEMLEEMENEHREKSVKKRIQFVYVVVLLLKTGLEAVFLWLQYVLYGFRVPELFECERKPCPKIVDCFVSRPQEKTLFLWFMFVVSCICLSLNIAEIHYLGFKKLFKILSTGGYSREIDAEDNAFESTDTDVFQGNENNGKGSKKSSHKTDEEIKPSAPPREDPIYTVVDYDEKKKDDPIGFDAIGNQPPYAAPGYPFVHRYGMYLNATPPPPQPKEPEKYYV